MGATLNGVAPILIYEQEKTMPLPDYLASLADLEAYPDTLIPDITAEYDTDIAAQVSVITEKDVEIARLMAVNTALQEVNTQLIASVGVAPSDNNDNPDNTPDGDDDTPDEGDISYDDLLESE